MPVTIAPSAEACQALVDRINTGTLYRLPTPAEYSRKVIDALEEVSNLRVDVEAFDEVQLNETLTVEDATSHTIRVWVRERLADKEPETIDRTMLVLRRIFQRLNNWDSANRRVRVWEADINAKETPDKSALRDLQQFVGYITLRVEVGASA